MANIATDLINQINQLGAGLDYSKDPVNAAKVAAASVGAGLPVPANVAAGLQVNGLPVPGPVAGGAGLPVPPKLPSGAVTPWYGNPLYIVGGLAVVGALSGILVWNRRKRSASASTPAPA